ncbi:hypothetical protein [Methylomarinovum tepidoasis]|uniref:hypothetical protein n=1 Tax=Methylomarinovum tepidoasis TaxID=2840183 RepID=UPI00257426DA|nr:hypothetical protein [Methylomarinovum sp. IN45]
MTTFLNEKLELSLIGFATLVYSAGFMAIASVGYLLDEIRHLLTAPPEPQRH